MQRVLNLKYYSKNWQQIKSNKVKQRRIFLVKQIFDIKYFWIVCFIKNLL